MKNRTDYIKLPGCKKGYLYKIQSRNLRLGVYDGKEGFIGIRTKFNDRYLFIEYHYDQGPPYGTVRPIEELEKVPDNIEITENKPLFDYLDKRLTQIDQLESGAYV